ncbi:heterokaryon incompatibility protein-domain-containing protein [Xylogone sp. PMI_703]|nr:heterokaryon incompatibility protein-domain-containing protein [Xylogone sp. PMI_703]
MARDDVEPDNDNENGVDWETDESDSESQGDEMGLDMPPLLPVPDVALPGDRLCDTCKALELTPRRFVVLPDDPDKGKNIPDSLDLPLGLVKDIRQKIFCPLCRLVIVALGGEKVPVEENGKPTSVVMSWNTDGPKADPNQPWNHDPQIRILRPYCQLADGDFVDSVRLNLFPEITLLANDSPVPSKTFFARPIPQDKIDFGMVRNWFSLCEMWHGDRCDEVEMLDSVLHPKNEIEAFRVIDVIDNCLVRGDSNCTYAALSYVWGRVEVLRTMAGNIDRLEQPGSLKLPEFYDKIPWTVRDAMEATKEMGLRYLWVDSLCIVQDDTTGEKADYISKMDLVYALAYVTIVAATGHDANAGLPGVRPGTQNYHQPIEELAPGFRLAFKPRAGDYLFDAVYETRGWTFQEKLFSRRTLRFVGGGVVYHCRQADEWREDVVFENGEGILGDLSMPERDNDIGRFEGLIQSYSGMNFTFDSDIYHAFTGVAKFISRQLKSSLCHGIPEAYFDWFLLWTNLGEQTRRQKAPSWSWSGWIGESWPRMWDWYSRDARSIREALRNRTWIIWYHRAAHDSEKCRLVWSHNRQSSQSRPRNFYGGEMQNRFNIDCSQTVPTPKTLVNAPEYFVDTLNPHPGSGFLQFWTVSVTLRLNTPVSSERDRGPTKMDKRFGIFGKDGKEMGNIYVNKNWSSGNIAGEHEFILLCEGRDKRAEGNNDPDDEPGWRYMVMLLEWHGEWAERVSVGSIRKNKVDQALGKGPVWKEIILG